MSQAEKIEELYFKCLKESQDLRATMYELAKANPARERIDAPNPFNIGIGIKKIGENLVDVGNNLINLGGES